MINFNVHRELLQYLPPELRTPRRVSWLMALTMPLVNLWSYYEAWRKAAFFEAAITGQRMALEVLLNYQFCGGVQRIRIENGQDLGCYVRLNADEGAECIMADDGAVVGLHGESIAEGYSFAVLLPPDIDREEVEGVVSKWVIAGRTFIVRNL